MTKDSFEIVSTKGKKYLRESILCFITNSKTQWI